MEENRKTAIKIIDKFEELLTKYDMKIPSEDRAGNEDEAAIYGTNYFDLEDEITNILDRQLSSKNVRYSIMTNSKFMLCNNHSFEEIKNSNISELAYEKTHDLAFLKDVQHSISAYLGVYDNKFYLTYSVHGKNNFDITFDNIKAEIIDINKINSLNELEMKMKQMMGLFFINNRDYIEKYSMELDSVEVIEVEEDPEEIQ